MRYGLIQCCNVSVLWGISYSQDAIHCCFSIGHRSFLFRLLVLMKSVHSLASWKKQFSTVFLWLKVCGPVSALILTRSIIIYLFVCLIHKCFLS